MGQNFNRLIRKSDIKPLEIDVKRIQADVERKPSAESVTATVSQSITSYDDTIKVRLEKIEKEIAAIKTELEIINEFIRTAKQG